MTEMAGTEADVTPVTPCAGVGRGTDDSGETWMCEEMTPWTAGKSRNAGEGGSTGREAGAGGEAGDGERKRVPFCSTSTPASGLAVGGSTSPVAGCFGGGVCFPRDLVARPSAGVCAGEAGTDGREASRYASTTVMSQSMVGRGRKADMSVSWT